MLLAKFGAAIMYHSNLMLILWVMKIDCHFCLIFWVCVCFFLFLVFLYVYEKYCSKEKRKVNTKYKSPKSKEKQNTQTKFGKLKSKKTNKKQKKNPNKKKGLLNYPMYYTIRETLRDNIQFQTVRTKLLLYESQLTNYDSMGNFIDNHDNVRFLYENNGLLLRFFLYFFCFFLYFFVFLFFDFFGFISLSQKTRKKMP